MPQSDMNDPKSQEAMEHVRAILRFIGEDPNREGLLDTPKRVVKAWNEHFWGYHEDPMEPLSRTFTEIEGYDELVLLQDIEVHSHCEHHMVPFVGKAHVGYIPNGKVTGLSKLARVVEIYSKRLQVQEKHRPDRRCDLAGPSAARRRGGPSVSALLHVLSRRATARSNHDHQQAARDLPVESGSAGGVLHAPQSAPRSPVTAGVGQASIAASPA
jgi:hypothetical protein